MNEDDLKAIEARANMRWHELLAEVQKLYRDHLSWRFVDGPARNDVPVVAARFAMEFSQDIAALIAEVRRLHEIVNSADHIIQDWKRQESDRGYP